MGLCAGVVCTLVQPKRTLPPTAVTVAPSTGWTKPALCSTPVSAGKHPPQKQLMITNSQDKPFLSSPQQLYEHTCDIHHPCFNVSATAKYLTPGLHFPHKAGTILLFVSQFLKGPDIFFYLLVHFQQSGNCPKH